MSEINFEYNLSVDCVNRHNKVRDNIAINLTFSPDDALLEATAQPSGCDFLFLLDTSGSMQETFSKGNTTITKLQGTKEAVSGLVPSLTSHDTVTLIHYNTNPAIILNQVRGDRHQELRQAIEDIPQTDGATDFEAALLMATRYIESCKQPAKRILFLTDGVHYGKGTVEEARRLNGELGKNGVIVDCMGVGKDPDMTFLGELATEGGGQSAWLETPAEAVSKFSSTIDTARNTLLSNVRLQLEFPSSCKNIEVFATHPETRYHTPDAQQGHGGSTTVNLPPFSISDTYEFILKVDAELNEDTRVASQILATAKLIFDIPARGVQGQTINIQIPLALTEGSPAEVYDTEIEALLTKAFLMKYNADLNVACRRQEWDKAQDLLHTMISTADRMHLREDAENFRKKAEKLKDNYVLTQEDLNTIFKMSSSSSGLSTGSDNKVQGNFL